MRVVVERQRDSCGNEMRTLPLYFSSICLTVGTTREQNGHWKSENSTICTGAFVGPTDGALPASTL